MSSPSVSWMRLGSAALLGLSLACHGSLANAADAHAPEAKAEGSKKKGAKDEAAKPEASETQAKAAQKSDGAAPEGKPAPKAEPVAEHKAQDHKGQDHKVADPKAAEQKSAKSAPRDSMEVLRERLAEKLGATKAASPNVMRVAARSPVPAAATGHAAHGARPARVAPSAAALAAAHRDSGHASAGGHGGAAGHAAHWDYKGDAGPESWGKLKPEFAQCSTGARQSPIDIRDGIKVQLDAVQIDYKPSGFRVVDNGHTVQVNVEGGNSIEVIGRRYDLVQFHFHRPSEERINGRLFDMVAHLVHKDMEGRLAVIAVLLDRGSAHPIIQTIWNNLPLEKGEEVAARAVLDLNALLPADRRYYTYMGSLTTPPCSEGVLWMVMKNPVTISAEQIGIFSRLYPMNARPIQSASGRLIKESD
jgi:carbonic anhydrase